MLNRISVKLGGMMVSKTMNDNGVGFVHMEAGRHTLSEQLRSVNLLGGRSYLSTL
jgi:hypothetical protein